ncbi:hypothetical protein [uncultured Halopseudomonas sp.]|uniref:phage tail tube protein n=1 Tax=uncultured Halopseudomonas sp. TaxID=2901193 RepID=UPI0030EE2BA7|tara:strand:- start:27756 stop:28535 length:780 start_codon:yes stop_codon:yes gene_type:complete
MPLQPKYMYGQGVLEVAEIISPTVDGPWVDIGDASSLEGTVSETAIQHRESRSGKKALVRNFGIEANMAWSVNIHQLDAPNIARFTQGTVSSAVAGTVTGEEFPDDLEAGDVITLDEFGPSDLVILDSAATPVTLDPEHYAYNAYGDVEILSLPDPAPTQPFTASYSYAARRQVAMLNSKRKQYRLRYKGINLAENEQPFILELYKLDAGLLQTLSLITSGNQVAQAPVTFTSLADTTKRADGELGQFGRLIEIGEGAA